MSRTKRACCGPLVGHPAAWLLVGLAVLASNRSAPADTGGISPFVAAGKAVCAREVGNPWNRQAGFLEGSGLGNFLYANRLLAGGDFCVRARLSLAGLDGTAAALVLGDNHIGFDGQGRKLFVEGPTLGPGKFLDEAAAPIAPGRPFEVVLCRRGDALTVQIDGKEVWKGSFRPAEGGLIGLRPHRGTMRVYEFSASGSLSDVPRGQWPPLKTNLFEAYTNGYVAFRIPGIVVTRRGVVLAYCAARKNGSGDWDHIDIAMRRSLDKGASWQPPKILVGEGKTTIDNPTAIVDRQTGAVHFLYQMNYARCYYMRSDDDGETFTAPVDITPTFEQFRKDYDWTVLAPGPGHGIQLDNGRLLVPVWLSTGGHSHHPSCMSTVYSDDHGRTWRRGEIVARNTPETPNPNETVAVQLADGRVMLNIRNESPRFRRLVAFSPDGATGWTKPVYDEALFEPICFASIVRAIPRPGRQGSCILFSNPDSRSVPVASGWKSRESLSIKASEDEGRTWPVSRVLEPGGSGYSDLAVLPDGTVLFLYENGGVGGKAGYATHYLTLARFPVEWVYSDPRERLSKTVRVGRKDIPIGAPPAGLVVRRDLGILTSACVEGQIIHRARWPNDWLFETRATITPGGDYLLMFPDGGHYGGQKHKVNDLLAYRSSDKGTTWVGPTVAYKIDYNQHGFIPLIPRGSKRIYAFGTQPVWDKFDGRENAPIGYRYSDDDGHTWSAVQLIEPVNDPGYLGMSVMRMCETQKGTWLLGTHEGDWVSNPKAVVTRQYVLRSEDQGKTWTLLPGKRPGGWFVHEFDRMDELRPISLGGGRVLALARTCEGHLWELRSDDDGKTWTTPKPTALVHPDAPPMLFQLADGKTLVAFHHNVHSGGHFNMRDRSQIWVSLSTDEGRSWSQPRFVFANALDQTAGGGDFRNYQCSYLDMIADGEDLHLFLPHRWQRVLHLHVKADELRRLPTKADMDITP